VVVGALVTTDSVGPTERLSSSSSLGSFVALGARLSSKLIPTSIEETPSSFPEEVWVDIELGLVVLSEEADELARLREKSTHLRFIPLAWKFCWLAWKVFVLVSDVTLLKLPKAPLELEKSIENLFGLNW
jgi:hypothetical protein